jgi:hypothetical protein
MEIFRDSETRVSILRFLNVRIHQSKFIGIVTTELTRMRNLISS